MMSNKLFNAVTATGASRTVPVEPSKDSHTVQAEMGGTVVAIAVTITLEGSLDGVSWVTLATHAFSAAEITAEESLFHVTGKPMPFIRLNLTALTGGSSASVSAWYQAGDFEVGRKIEGKGSIAVSPDGSFANVSAAYDILQSAVNAVPNTDAAVDVFLYDTRNDSDGGKSRNSVANTSLGKFPEVGLLVVVGGSTDTVSYYDALDLDSSGVPVLFKAWTLTNPSSVTAKDGKIVIGTSAGVTVIDLVADEVLNYDATDLARADQLPSSFDMSTVTWTSVTTAGAIVSAAVNDVAITILSGAPIDSATGLPIPTIAAATDAGVSVIQSDGTVDDLVQTSGDDVNEAAFNFFGDVIFPNETAGELDIFRAGGYSADNTTPDDLYDETTSPTLLAAPTTTKNGIVDFGTIAIGSASGLTLVHEDRSTITNGMACHITSAYNSGWMPGAIKGAWLGTTGLTDLSVHSNDLTHNGTVPTAVVATGADLIAHGVFSAANNFTAASNAEWDVVTTGALTASIWFKTAANSAVESYLGFANAGDTLRFIITIAADGTLNCIDDGATASVGTVSAIAYDDGNWHKVDFIRTSSTARALYVDGLLITSNTTDAGSLTSSGNLPLAIGVDSDGSTTPATTSSLALARVSAYAPTEAQIKKMYNDEKHLFNANASAFIIANAVTAVAYDGDSDKLYVATASGASVMRGLEIVDELTSADLGTASTYNSASAARNMYLLGNATESVFHVPSRNIAEKLPEVDAQPPKLILTGTTPDATGALVVGSIPISENESATITLTVRASNAVEAARGTDNAAYVIIANVFRAIGGNVTLQGQTAVSTIENTAGMACVVAANTTPQTIEVQVTGVASTVIEWVTTVEINSNIDRWLR